MLYKKLLQTIGIRNFHIYLDDILLYGSYDQVANDLALVRSFFKQWNIPLNNVKSSDEPVQKLTYLGITLDTTIQQVSLDPLRKKQIYLALQYAQNCETTDKQDAQIRDVIKLLCSMFTMANLPAGTLAYSRHGNILSAFLHDQRCASLRSSRITGDSVLRRDTRSVGCGHTGTAYFWQFWRNNTHFMGGSHCGNPDNMVYISTGLSYDSPVRIQYSSDVFFTKKKLSE
ncbi:Uncharacterised protein at_DN1115 [Pycnogonum litorale]